ncbi:MAG: deoxyuridine 5'-triphosphate nucleotidohydrolase [Dehalococcoidia bacterium]|nr:MAG: deoxyuridine 5'-triphosphate nucleotidohydrolase [Dehalococcoidia bacterium]
MATILSKQNIEKLLACKPPLIEGLISPKKQLQPNGVDLTLRDIALFQSPGKITTSNSQRVVSELSPLMFNGLGFIHLAPGIYSITYNEIVHLPEDIMALATPRSSLLRCGVTINTAVWDAGYSGRSQSLLVVYHPQGFQLQKNARIIQLVFFRLPNQTEGYSGTYQHENLD